jgi:hypothetical protein
MRTVQIEFLDDIPKTAQTADHRDIEAIFTGFDAQLAKHGLEVVTYDTGTDSYAWSVEDREGRDP